MKKLFIWGIIAFSLLLTACNKGAFSSQLQFSVSDELETKAILNGADESGLDITWEEGDQIEYSVEVYRNLSQEQGPDLRKAIDKVEGKLVYENGYWVTYEANGSSYKQVDFIFVRSSTLESVIRSRFQCQNGDLRQPTPDTFTAEWVQTVPFAEGQQTILVRLPLGNSE